MKRVLAFFAVAAAAAVSAGHAPGGAEESAVPIPADAHGVAVKISSWGPRPAARPSGTDL